ncbi:MAG: LysR family transcriptional regulator, partial [Rhodospirillales bacterium]|nr:LysR family transcriptional regulator [Rhodospirillales bacterium]
MNLRRLGYFVKIVDIGSLTQAADVLHIAQPALSQQLATLEGEVRQQLLVRTKRGVTPTEAGRTLYRHAQLILRQCAQARLEMHAASELVTGAVAVGLAPGTAAAGLALPLL